MLTINNQKQPIAIPPEALNTMGRLLFLAVVKHKEEQKKQIHEPNKKGA